MINPASQVAELVRVLVKALRAFQMYLPNNPVYQRAVQSLGDAFPPVWEFTDHLMLAVVESQVIWEQEVVYEHDSRAESFAWLLYKDGLRFLTLHRGVETEEIGRFLQVVNQARLLTPDSGDDLLTLLWTEDFQHIEYRFVEVLSENLVVLDPQAVDLEGPQRAEETAQVIREEAQQERPAGMVDLDEFDSTLYFLDEAEVETLRREVQAEYQRDVRMVSLDALFDVFELYEDAEVRGEVLGILEQLLPGLLANGEYGTVARILRELRQVASRVQLAESPVGARFERFEANLSEPTILGQILRSLDDAATAPEDADIGELLRELRPAALGTVASHLPMMRHSAIRDAMGAAAERLVAAHPREAVRLLESGLPEVLEGLVPVVGRARLAPALPALAEILRRPEAPIRLVAVEALAAIGTPGAMGFLERSLEDEDRSVRLAGLTAVSTRGWKGGLKRLEAVVQGKGRDDLERAERRQFFEAYAQIAGPAGLGPLADILEPRGLFRRRENAETRTCAAYAVARIRTAEARQLLERVQNDRELAVRNAAMRALREWRE
jgi:hypothetical protein